MKSAFFLCFCSKIVAYISFFSYFCSRKSYFMESHIEKYESVLAEYRTRVMDKMSPYDYNDYREAVLEKASCELEGKSFSIHPVYKFMLSHVGERLNVALLKEIHRLCCEDGDHEELIARVPQLLEATQQAMDMGETHPVCIAARFHCFFEYLHPFRDGNGRTGRLMANFILLSKNHPMVIIPNEQKSEYIRALQMYRREHSVEFIEHFFLSTAIARMEHEMNEKRELTARSKLRFII